MEIDTIKYLMPKKLSDVFLTLDKMPATTKRAAINRGDYLSIAKVANEYAQKNGIKRDGKLFYRGMLLASYELNDKK